MTEQEVKTKFPSLCHTCKHGRKPASNENRDKGYVGCAEACRRDGSWDHVTEVQEIAEGWVDLRSRVFAEKGSGIITNLQLMMLEVKQCKAYTES